MSDLTNFSDGEPNYEKPKKKANPAIAFIFFALMSLLGFFMGISGFIKESRTLDEAFGKGLEKGTCVSGVPAYGVNEYSLDYVHKINFIPILHEYYFVISSEDQSEILLVRAPKDFGENFDGDTFRNLTGVEIKGNVKSTADKVSEHFRKAGAVDLDAYIDLLSTRRNIEWLIIGVFNALLLIWIAVRTVKHTDQFSKATGAEKIWGSIIFIGYAYSVYLLICMMAQL